MFITSPSCKTVCEGGVGACQCATTSEPSTLRLTFTGALVFLGFAPDCCTPVTGTFDILGPGAPPPACESWSESYIICGAGGSERRLELTGQLFTDAVDTTKSFLRITTKIVHIATSTIELTATFNSGLYPHPVDCCAIQSESMTLESFSSTICSQGTIALAVSASGGNCPRRASGAFTVGGATIAASASSLQPTYSATLDRTIRGAAIAAAATFTQPMYSASANLMAPGADFSGTAVTDTPIYSGTASLATGGADFSGSATATQPTYSATANLTAGRVSFSGSAESDQPTYSATANLTVGRATFSGSATATVPTYSGSASLTAPGADFSGAAMFVKPTYSATAALTAPGADFTGSGTVQQPTYSGTANLEAPAALFSGTATATDPATSSSGTANLEAPGAEFSGVGSTVCQISTCCSGPIPDELTVNITAMQTDQNYEPSTYGACCDSLEGNWVLPSTGTYTWGSTVTNFCSGLDLYITAELTYFSGTDCELRITFEVKSGSTQQFLMRWDYVFVCGENCAAWTNITLTMAEWGWAPGNPMPCEENAPTFPIAKVSAT